MKPTVTEPEKVPLSSARAMRFAMTRAADQAYGMPVTVDDVTEQQLALDDLVQELLPEAMIVALERNKSTIGCLTVDPQLRSALIEFQATGKVSEMSATERPITGTDMLLSAPLTSYFLTKSEEAALGSDLQSWVEGVTTGHRFESPRGVGLALADGGYRVLTLTVGLAGERKGTVKLVLPDTGGATDICAPVPEDTSWAEDLESAVLAAPAALTAELTKITLSIGQVERLDVGQVFPLFGATVGSVRLISANRFEVCSARLGQSMGKRAVRVGPNLGLALSDMPKVQALAG